MVSVHNASVKSFSFYKNGGMVTVFNNTVKKHIIAHTLQSNICDRAKSLFLPSAHPEFEVNKVIGHMKECFADSGLVIRITPKDGHVAQLLVRAPPPF